MSLEQEKSFGDYLSEEVQKSSSILQETNGEKEYVSGLQSFKTLEQAKEYSAWRRLQNPVMRSVYGDPATIARMAKI